MISAGKGSHQNMTFESPTGDLLTVATVDTIPMLYTLINHNITTHKLKFISLVTVISSGAGGLRLNAAINILGYE